MTTLTRVASDLQARKELNDHKKNYLRLVLQDRQTRVRTVLHSGYLNLERRNVVIRETLKAAKARVETVSALAVEA